MPWGAVAGLVGAGLSYAGTQSSNSAANQRQNEADAVAQQALALQQQSSGLWNGLNVPNLTPQAYGGYSWLNNVTPDQFNATTLPFDQMSDNPQAIAEEQQSYDALSPFAAGGLTNTDKIALSQTNQQQLGAGQSNIEATLDAMRAEGNGGAGAEEAARLSGDQSAANSTQTLYQNALQAAAQRQLAAIQLQGSEASNLRGQDASISSQMANMANQYNSNIMNLQTNTAAANAAAVNQAAYYNNAGQQQTAQSQVDAANKNIDQAHQIQQQNFANQVQKISGQSNALNAQATGDFAQSSALGQQANAADQNSIANLGAVLNGAKTGAQIANNPGGFTTSGNSTSGNSLPNVISNLFNTSGQSNNTIDTSGTGAGADPVNTDPNEFGAFTNG